GRSYDWSPTATRTTRSVRRCRSRRRRCGHTCRRRWRSSARRRASKLSPPPSASPSSPELELKAAGEPGGAELDAAKPCEEGERGDGVLGCQQIPAHAVHLLSEMHVLEGIGRAAVEIRRRVAVAEGAHEVAARDERGRAVADRAERVEGAVGGIEPGRRTGAVALGEERAGDGELCVAEL